MFFRDRHGLAGLAEMIVIIDNYDSFTYNIVQTLGGLGAKMEIFRNDKIGLDEVGQFTKILLL